MDNGGFFPEDDVHEEYAPFLMDAMKILGTDAVGMSEKELRFGYAYLKGQLKRSGLPIVCANLNDKVTRKAAFAPYRIRELNGIKIGYFGLISDKVDLGPARDSLYVVEPSNTARTTIAEMKKKGATVIVLLSQLGKVESEDLVSAVDGVDAVIVGHNVPMIQSGRMVKNTVACYGGEQGQYLGRTVLTLNATHKVTSGENEMFLLGPEVGERKEMADLVKGFEDAFNALLAKREKEQAVANARADSTASAPDHFVGTEVCIRCHVTEGDQWKTTPHARAWQTLVDKKKDAMPECVSCHVVGHHQPGGFISGPATPAMENVGCENCHGMGTSHDAFAATKAATRINETTCLSCHTSTTSPDFSFARFKPYIDHTKKFSDLPVLKVAQPMKDVK